MVEDTPEPMTLARFTELVEAYGSRLERWPIESREAARALALNAEARAILARAAELDALLDTYVVEVPGAALQGRILASVGKRSALRRRLLRWWEGLGIVGVGLAGIAVGVVAMSVVLSEPSDGTGIYDQPTTVFGDVSRISDLPQEAQ
jgi:hypothetical protein